MENPDHGTFFTLPKEILPVPHDRLDGSLKLFSRPVEGQLQRVPLTLTDLLRQLLPQPDRLPVHDFHMVAAPDPGLPGRGPLFHQSDGAVIRGIPDHKHPHKNEQGKENIREGTGGNDQKTGEQRLVVEGTGLILRRQSLLGILTDHFDIAAQGNGRKAVLRLTDLLPGQPGTEAERKLFDPHMERFGDKEMSQLMDEDENAQNNNKGNCAGQHNGL